MPLPWKFTTVPLVTVISVATKSLTASLKTAWNGMLSRFVGVPAGVESWTEGSPVSETIVNSVAARLALPARSFAAPAAIFTRIVPLAIGVIVNV